MWKTDHHNNLNFAMSYAYSENFILPLSHDEVVHLKGSMINKMAGNYDEKFALLKTLLAFQYSHPGKKLNFMGNELAQFNEWNENVALDWMLLGYPKHNSYHEYVRNMNMLYRNNPTLYENDGNWQGFKWITVDDAKDNLLSYCRFDKNGKVMFVILNFSKNYYHDFGFESVPKGDYDLILNSNDIKWSGVSGKTISYFHCENGVFLDVPPQTALYYKSK